MVTLTVDVSAVTDGQTIDAADVTVPVGQLKTHLENTLNGVQAFDQLNLGNPGSTLVIASDAITATRSNHIVDTEGGAATDNLSTINGGAIGDVLTLQIANNARLVVVKHNVGNIRLAYGRDVTLTDTNRAILLYHTGSVWIDISSFAMTAISGGPSASLTISSDAVTIVNTNGRYTVDTEGGAASDFLSTINGGTAGDRIQLSIASAARTVTVKYGVGNILLSNRVNLTLSDTDAILSLVYSGSNWVQESGRQEFAPRPTQRKFRSVVGAAAAFEVTNVAAVTTAGTLSSANDVNTTYVNALSGNVAGNVAGFVTATFNLCRRQHYPTFYALVQTVAAADIANVRIWVGLATAAIANIDDPAVREYPAPLSGTAPLPLTLALLQYAAR